MTVGGIIIVRHDSRNLKLKWRTTLGMHARRTYTSCFYFLFCSCVAYCICAWIYIANRKKIYQQLIVELIKQKISISIARIVADIGIYLNFMQTFIPIELNEFVCQWQNTLPLSLPLYIVKCLISKCYTNSLTMEKRNGLVKPWSISD